MELQNVWTDLVTLPPHAQQEVADFVAFLKQRYQPTPASSPAAEQDWTSEPFVGLWQDREDMHSSVQWIRDLRQQEWMA